MEFGASEAAFLDHALTTFQVEQQIPAMSTAVLYRGEVVHENIATSDWTRPINSDTQFRIASMTKSFTAALVHNAVAADLITSLDDPISLYLPEFQIQYINEDDPDITIRQLLHHTAGFVSDDDWGDNQLSLSDDDFEALLSDGLSLSHSPGTRFEYSNTGYAILGRLITRVYTHDFHDVMMRELIQPLEMSRTSWTAIDDNWARPFDVVDGVVVAEPTPLGPGTFDTMAGLWSTPRDMLKWVQIFLDAENPHLVADRYESILTAASRRASQHAGTELGTRLIKARPDVGGVPQPGYIASPYGYGAGLYMWFDEVLGRAVGHAGGLPGYGSHMRWFTQENFAVVSMGNKRYARMAVPIQETMNEMSRRSIGKRNGYEVPVTRELSGLAQSLVDIVNKWDDQLAGHIFSNNVPVDMSYARRAAQFASIIKTTGPLTLESITAETRARATVIASGPNGSVEIEFRRSPRNIPEIQHYEITLLK